MRLIRFLLSSLLVASIAGTGAARQVVRLSELSTVVDVASHLQPGAIVRGHGLTLETPRTGYGLWAEAKLAGGGAVELSIQTGSDGEPTVRHGSTTPGLQLQATGTTDPCADGAYSLGGFKWTTAYAWRFASATTPSNLTVSGAEGSLKSAANHITNGYNNCGLADNISATNAYLGRTSSAPNITNSAGCSTSDGKSVVGFGALPKGYLGMTCWWTMNGVPTEADLKLNKYYYRWYVSKPSSCSSMWSIKGAATHEFGHIFGLGHVSETYHPKLTMSPTIYSCQGSESTLGLGDIRGLNSLY
jgi:hypothetical protein